MHISAYQPYLEENLPAYLDILRQMVDINSFTGNPAGVNDLGKLTARFFARLGFNAEFVQSINPSFGQHLFLHRPAALGIAAPTFALISHMDTVFPPEEEIANRFSWRREDTSSGKRIYGPGTNDIKGGTVMIYMLMDALHAIDRQSLEAANWLVCLDASEERLSDDFGAATLRHLPENTRACLVFEAGTPTPGSLCLVTGRKGRASFHVVAEGRGAHAGNHHAQGANAIVQLAHTVQKIAALTDYQQSLTFNVGVTSGGSVVNRVPHSAEAWVEMRTFSPQVFEAGCQAMLTLDGSSDVSSADGYPCRISIYLESQSAPWPPNPQTEALYTTWQQAADELGQQVSSEQRGGLSDGNLLCAHFPTLDGLGPIGANAHCSERSPDGEKEQEYVEPASFVPKALLNLAAIKRLIS